MFFFSFVQIICTTHRCFVQLLLLLHFNNFLFLCIYRKYSLEKIKYLIHLVDILLYYYADKWWYNLSFVYFWISNTPPPPGHVLVCYIWMLIQMMMIIHFQLLGLVMYFWLILGPQSEKSWDTVNLSIPVTTNQADHIKLSLLEKISIPPSLKDLPLSLPKCFGFVYCLFYAFFLKLF